MKSIIAFPTDYIVVDIETTGKNPKLEHILELAAIRYRDSKEVARYAQLISIGHPIRPFISRLTGITDEMLEGCPSIEVAIRNFADFIGDDILIGHNIASFDSCFIAEAYRIYLNRELTNSCVDTLRIHKKLFPKWPTRTLEAVASMYRIPYKGAHRGLNDCEITNACYQGMRNEIMMTTSIEEFCGRFVKKTSSQKLRELSPTVSSFDSDNPFYQKIIVFTGALSMTRQDAMQMAIDVGAVPKTSVTAKTSYLVVGGQDISRVGDDGMSTKEEKAHALNTAGKANIQIISEEEFLRMVPKEGATEKYRPS